MRAVREFMSFYIVPVVLLIGVVLTAAFMLLYTFTARTRAGAVVGANWPKTLTMDFSRYIIDSGGAPDVADEGKTLLRDNGLWLQVLDDSGKEVLACDKPDEIPDTYRPYELLRLYQYGSGEYSVFLSRVKPRDTEYTYLIGFPMSLSKVVMYVDNARYSSGRALIIAVAALTLILVLTLTVYSYKSFRDSETRRERDDRAKEEWLANITHDLKTPLAPIRGYAELLSEGDIAADEARRYGGIILKNVMYAGQLVDDLKLTYQLQSDMLPLKAEEADLTRFVRELVIDLLNAPEYEGREISFVSGGEDVRCAYDAQLLRRALTNVTVNALKHNTPDTKICVSVSAEHGAKIAVSDNGVGMTPQELDGLFKRYYRGTSTEVRAEGSGLGMAIAAQIVRQHGGSISAESSPGCGTTVTIRLPQ